MGVFSHSPKLRKYLPMLTIIPCAITLISSITVLPRLPEFRQWSDAFVNGGGTKELEKHMNAAIGIVIGASLGLSASIAAMLSNLVPRGRSIVFTIYMLATIAAACTIVAEGVIFLQLFDLIDESSFVGNPNDLDENGESPFSTLELQYIDFNSAIFNTCCVSRGYSETDAIVECTGSNEDQPTGDCPLITNSKVKDFLDPVLLCTCTSPGGLPKMVASLGPYTEGDPAHLCTIMEDWMVNVDSNTKIPTTPFDITDATKAQYPDYSYTAVPVVGKPKPQGVEANKGFGCGFGYAKGIMWVTSMYVEQQIQSLALVGIGSGSTLFFIIIVAFAVNAVQNCEDREGEWANKEDVPAHFAVTTVEQVTQKYNSNFAFGTGSPPPPVNSMPPMAAVAAGGSSVHSSHSAHSSNRDAADPIAAKLRAFYKRHDPDKSLADVNDVAGWAAEHGVVALNEKLLSKYGSDLNSVDDTSVAGKVAVLGSMPDI